MSEDTGEATSSELPLAPGLGYREYWYPLIESRKVRAKPVALRVLGEGLVLFRAGGRVAALADRCAHRGAILSKGRMLFPGTVSCPYHGWTYNSEGECVAALAEGPDSRVPGTVRIRSYPTEERAGVVWGFIGEGDPPPLDDDLPPPIGNPDNLIQCFFEEWACDWRNLTENYPDLCHVPIVHRTSIDMLFRKISAWASMTRVEPLPDHKGLVVGSRGGEFQGEFPGLGIFPRRTWWRVFSSASRPPDYAMQVRMPGYIVLQPRPTALFSVQAGNIQWPVPVDANRTRVFEVTYARPTSPLHRAGLLAWYHLFYGWEHPRMFASQDRNAVEGQTYRVNERLSTTDIGVVQWRHLSAQIAAERLAATRRKTREDETSKPDSSGAHTRSPRLVAPADR